MRPCNRPRLLMPNAAWKRWRKAHPFWTAPILAPCTVAAAGIATVAAPVVAWFFLPRSAPPVWSDPPAVSPWLQPGTEWATYAGTPLPTTHVPEPASWMVLAAAVVLLVVLRWAR